MWDAPPLFLKYVPTEGVLVMLGAVIVLLAAGLGAIWVLLHLMEDLHHAVPDSAPLSVQ